MILFIIFAALLVLKLTVAAAIPWLVVAAPLILLGIFFIAGLVLIAFGVRNTTKAARSLAHERFQQDVRSDFFSNF